MTLIMVFIVQYPRLASRNCNHLVYLVYLVFFTSCPVLYLLYCDRQLEGQRKPVHTVDQYCVL